MITKHEKLEPRTCPNCGASIPLGKSKCEYCGTIFKGGDIYAPLIVEKTNPYMHVIKARVAIPRYAMERMSSEEQKDYILSEMKSQVADALLGLIEIRREFDPIDMNDLYEGRIRVIEPSFRY